MSLKKMMPIIEKHIERYPGFGAQDAYKLLYQRYLGPAHLIGNADEARLDFLKEYKSVKPDSNVELIESISEDDTVLRVYLAPYKAENYDPEKLFNAFLESGGFNSGGLGSFINSWIKLIKLTSEGKTGLDLDDIDSVDTRAQKSEYPPMRHSEEYKKHNKHDYRVVYRNILLKHLPELREKV